MREPLFSGGYLCLGDIKLIPDTEWVYNYSRKNFMAWWGNMDEREKSKEAFTTFSSRLNI
jgi:hypothetical protein